MPSAWDVVGSYENVSLKWLSEKRRKEGSGKKGGKEEGGRKEGRRKKGRYKTLLWNCYIPTAMIQNTIQGCLDCSESYYFSFSFPTLPLLKILFFLIDPGLVNIVGGEAEPGPALWKASNSIPWVSPGTRHHTADRAGATMSQKVQHRIPDWEFRKAEETSHLFVVFALSQSLIVSRSVLIDLAQEQANYSRGSTSWLPTCRSKAERLCLSLLRLVHSMPGRLRKTVIIVLCPLSCSPPLQW